jgi:putative CocE/NonD family hydrolase
MRVYRFVLFFLLCLLIAYHSDFTHGQTPLTQLSEVKIDPKIFDHYVGQYQDDTIPSDVIFSFFREGDRFYGQLTNRDKFEIFALSETKFFRKSRPLIIEFVLSEDGTTISARFPYRGKDHQAKKISDQPAKDITILYKRTEAMIPMRDGVKLYTVILAPENQTEVLPILLDRTPYGVKRWDSSGVNAERPEFAQEGYIFVFQDIRGKSNSEGEFVMIRPPRDKRDLKSIDESTDTYDTIDYLIKNVSKNNGRVGIYGVSYDGWLASVALLDPHPALKACSPQAPLTDAWIGDDFFHNGAFRQSIGHEYIKEVETSKDLVDVVLDKDAYNWYLSLPTLSKLTEQLSGKLPTWNAFVAHPNYDEFWQRRGAENYLKAAPLPTLVVGGWWDQEDLYGALTTYKTLEKYDKNNQVFLVEGPWNHDGWWGRGRRLEDIDFGSNTGRYFRQEIQAPWFAYYLKDQGTLKQAEATLFQSGSNKWMTYEKYPPRANTQKRSLYLQTNGLLSFEKPGTNKLDDSFDSYISDPSNPVPYRKRPIEATYDPKGSGWYTWLIQDQRFLGDRKDVLSWQTNTLSENLTITGDIIADLFAATSGTDSDWVVKLIDVYPSEYPADSRLAGYQLMVASEIMRGRFNKSFERPQPIKANQVNEYMIDLRGNDYVFRKGHRIMVQVQSSWFPLYDRNPQKYINNIFLAKENDFQNSTQRIYRSAKYPSHVEVSVALH